jgi:hypothetical protein
MSDKIWVFRDPRGYMLGVSAVYANGALNEAATHASSNEIRRVCDRVRTQITADRRKQRFEQDQYTLTLELHAVPDSP